MVLKGKRPKLSVLDRVHASLDAVTREPEPESVHFFRTSCRRLEAFAELLKGDSGRTLRKLSRRLEKPRRLAGRVRDLDVQTALLREVEIEGQREDRRRLLAELDEARARAARKLRKGLDEKTVAALRERILRARRLEKAEEAARDARRERAWERAVETLSGLPQEFPKVKAKNLHELRLACKSVRYTAEQALPMAVAQELIALMKQVQDAIGRWHDWRVLRERAQDALAPESALIRALRSHERTSRAEALHRGLEVVRPHVRVEQPAPLPAAARRPQATIGAKPSVASAS
jgi:CHAD domain-containing protein